MGKKGAKTIYTVGHSTRPIEQFIEILQAYEIQLLADVRTVPGSRHNPQFKAAALEKSLVRAGIRYVHMKNLGGLRKPTKDSVNGAWRNASFRGFADYMQTAEFREGIEQLLQLASHERIVIMCAEAVPWRCHRSLIADALVAQDIDVVDIFDDKTAKPHKLTPFAVVDAGQVRYPAAATDTP